MLGLSIFIIGDSIGLQEFIHHAALLDIQLEGKLSSVRVTL